MESLLNSSKETRWLRTPTSRKRTAQYEQTQETQWIRDFERNFNAATSSEEVSNLASVVVTANAATSSEEVSTLAFWRFIWRFLFLYYFFLS
jgi:hypothetical protein